MKRLLALCLILAGLSACRPALCANDARTYAQPPERPHTWYAHNTVCVAGIAFRDVKPALTDRWYSFAALDLSRDGLHTFDLVASGLYVIGKVTVVREGDSVFVDWTLRHCGTNDSNFQPESEFLTFFHDLDTAVDVNPETFTGARYAFGEPISVENDLGGDTSVLLYICNRATYCDHLSYQYRSPIVYAPYRYDDEARIAQRGAMYRLMAADASAANE